jgi:hypothetical protein
MKTTFSLMALALLAAQQAFAVQPTIEYIPIDDTFIHQGCGFDVRIRLTGTMLAITHTDTQGAIRQLQAFQQGTALLTNVLTGKSITVKTNAPVTITLSPDGSFDYVATGIAAFGDDPDSFGTDTIIPGLFQVKGRYEWFVDPNGFTTFARTGTKIALCPKLQ